MLEQFGETFRLTPDKVAYGEKSVEYCIQQGAVDVLLLSDKMIRGYLFSSLHPSGQQLNNVSFVGEA